MQPIAPAAATAVDRFLEALTVRDFEQLATCLEPAAQARLLLPRGPEALVGGDEISRRIEKWFSSASEFQVLTCARDEIGPRQRASWRFRLMRDGESWELIEQTAFIDVGSDRIRGIDLLCSGFIRESQPEGPQVCVFDAGDMGCADGLAQEFRRQIASVAIGGSLVAIVRDPAAREDIPPLARMLGHSVTSVEDQAAGVLRITVERRR
ncbi:MAG TPA: sulfurtransferase TusA family protein [Candidatus Dormibacteraeota bacterium]|jgi:TusA-related sulfurtransferase